MSYLLYLLGLLPSLIWLSFYLRKDAHPESNGMVRWVFFLGIISAILAIILEKGFQYLFLPSSSWSTLTSLVAIFIGGAFIEELAKYLMVRIGTYRSPELDEPFDIMLYMIIAALGFAALENILILGSYHPFLGLRKALETMGWRFISATFLHALASGLLGYFLALSFFKKDKGKSLFFTGLISATVLHGLYNFSIMKIVGPEKLILPLLIIVILAWFVSASIKKLKRLKSVCLTEPKSSE